MLDHLKTALSVTTSCTKNITLYLILSNFDAKFTMGYILETNIKYIYKKTLNKRKYTILPSQN